MSQSNHKNGAIADQPETDQANQFIVATSGAVVVQEVLYETDKGREFIPLDEVGGLKPLPQPAVLTMEEAQVFANHYGHQIALHVATPELLANLKDRDWYKQFQEEPHQEQQQRDKPPITEFSPKPRNNRKSKLSRIKNRLLKLRHPKPTQTEKPKGKRKVSWLILFFVFCLGITLALFAAWNVQPFIGFVALVVAKFRFDEFLKWIFSFPLLGDFFLGVAAFGLAIVGTTIYVICQAFELGPMLYRRDPERVKRTINAWADWSKHLVNRSDPSALKELKRAHNNHPISTYQWLCNARDAVYIFELFVCAVIEPPTRPFWMLPVYLVTFQWQKIDWINVAMAVSILFAVQVIFAGILKLWPEAFPIVHSEEKHHAS